MWRKELLSSFITRKNDLKNIEQFTISILIELAKARWTTQIFYSRFLIEHNSLKRAKRKKHKTRKNGCESQIKHFEPCISYQKTYIYLSTTHDSSYPSRRCSAKRNYACLWFRFKCLLSEELSAPFEFFSKKRHNSCKQ